MPNEGEVCPKKYINSGERWMDKIQELTYDFTPDSEEA